MKIWVALLLTLLMASSSMAEKAKDKFAWRKLGPAMTEAKKANKMIFVDIYTDW